MGVQCEACFQEHDGSYGGGRFCDASCARSFSSRDNREETNKRISEALRGRKTPLSIEQIRAQALIQSETKKRQLLAADFDLLTVESKKRRVVLEQDGGCLKCGLSEWLGQPLVIQVDHEDGNSSNNTRRNLRGLCPNCHSQTKTWCGRNRKEKPDHVVSDEVLLNALLSSRSIAQALRKVGIHNRAGNIYSRCKKLLNS